LRFIGAEDGSASIAALSFGVGSGGDWAEHASPRPAHWPPGGLSWSNSSSDAAANHCEMNSLAFSVIERDIG
jgi:hypothetical protein